LIPAACHHDCDYAPQDDDEHILTEITLPSNREVIVDMRLECKLAFSYTELIIGCMGELAAKPYPVKYFNMFIAVGDGQIVEPGQSGHYIDKHKYYHVIPAFKDPDSR
jgi:hypothetical protein